MPTSEEVMPNDNVCLHILSSFNGCLRLWWCGNSHSCGRSIQTRSVPLMPSNTKSFRATGRQKLIITSMDGQSQMKFYKNIFPVSTGHVSLMRTRSELPVQQFSTCNKMLDSIISTTSQAKLTTKLPQIAEWSRRKKGRC